MNLKKLFAACAVTALCYPLASCCCGGDAEASLYENLPFEMAPVQRPEIPAYEVSLTDFGGVGDGSTLNTEAFANAFAALEKRGGGRLNVPSGVWYTGPIELKDNTELHLDRGAIIFFSNDKSLYPIRQVTFEGLDTWRCQSPLSATHVKNVAITGEGVIDGNGDAWRAVKRDKLTAGAWERKVRSGGIVSDDGRTWYPSESFKFGATTGSDQNVSTWATTKEDFERMHDFLRPVLVQIHYCENVLIEGVTIQNSPCWNIHPAMCKNIVVKGITVRCPDYAQNGDGIDFESCCNIEITDSSFDVGDDGICIKSGKDEAGRRRGIPCENIIVDNCTVFHGHGGFVVGSEMSGGVKNVKVSNCRFTGTDVGLRFKSTRGRGGVVENIFIDNVAMADISTEALLFDLFYGGKSASEALADGDEGEVTDMPVKPVDETTPQFRNIDIRNVYCRGARRAMLFNGLPEMNVENVTVENTAIYAQNGAQINESTGVTFRNVKVVPEKGPALMINNAKNIEIDGFACPEGMETALTVTGSRNENIKIASKYISLSNAHYSPRSEGKVTLE
ncbi:MAG: glycoside hydrolase family 28 protein [Alistipes sp.]|nr:glycoside hydrolase family 28 protein [Alistipes sp.]